MKNKKNRSPNISLQREIFLYFHTILHLKLSQIYFRVRKFFVKPKVEAISSVKKREPQSSFVLSIPKVQTMFSSNVFRFLNEEKRVSEEIDWNNPSWKKLWLYNLHYFDDLNSKNSQERIEWHKDLLKRWIKENPNGQGVGWQPYPSSLRIVNWIKWDLVHGGLNEEMLENLATQTNFLEQNLEYHLLGNHLLSNAKALIFAGCFFSGGVAEKWYEKGKKILGQELEEQILPDGGHFELSPMYHNLVLEDLLDIYNIQKTYGFEIAGKLKEKIKKMHEWSLVIRHEDNDIPFFNDATFNSSPYPGEIDNYLKRLGFNDRKLNNEKVFDLDHSGYVKIKQDNFSIIVDVGKIGPDYLPGHGHADALSFEISYNKSRFLVNSGISTYENNHKRRYQREAKSHNSLEIDGQSSSEVWDSFRVARRIRNVSHNFKINNCNHILVEGSHDGFKRLPGVGIHKRKWVTTNNRLIIRDSISGRGLHLLEFYFHLFPDFQVKKTERNHYTVFKGNLVIAKLFFDGSLDFETKETFFFPEFGKETPKITFQAENKVKLPHDFKTLEIVFCTKKN